VGRKLYHKASSIRNTLKCIPAPIFATHKTKTQANLRDEFGNLGTSAAVEGVFAKLLAAKAPRSGAARGAGASPLDQAAWGAASAAHPATWQALLAHARAEAAAAGGESRGAGSSAGGGGVGASSTEEGLSALSEKLKRALADLAAAKAGGT